MENIKTFQRLKKIIEKGLYDRETLMIDLDDFLEMGTITRESHALLLELIPEEEITRSMANNNITGYTTAGLTTHLLLKKQITKQVYSEESIKQMVTDFRIASTITRTQFTELKNLIDSTYSLQIEHEASSEER